MGRHQRGHANGPAEVLLERTFHRLVMTTSRYSLGTTMVPSPERVHANDQGMQIVMQLFLLRRLERCERFQHRAVIGLEHVEEVLRRAIAELEEARFRLDRARLRVEHFGQPRACSPQRRRFGPGGRRQIFAERLEDLSDKTFRRPVGEADLALGLADPQQLGRRAVLVRREHDAEGGEHRVEAVIVERQVFRVGFPEFDLHAFRRGARLAAFQQRRHVVGRGDVAPPPRRGKARHAVAGGDIEHLRAGLEIERLAEFFADDLQRRADDGVIARRPCGLLTRLEGGEVGGGWGSGSLRSRSGRPSVSPSGIMRPRNGAAMNRTWPCQDLKTVMPG